MRVGTYDGDTPRAARARLRREANILLTNPDMLHLGILPNHHPVGWLFPQLRFVVIDEAHVYRGVFGSHVGCVLRRLRRVCARYGSAPQFIACSATIANPGEHLQRLTGIEAAWSVDQQDGAPQEREDFVLWNPPFVDRARRARRSANSEAARLFARLVQAGDPHHYLYPRPPGGRADPALRPAHPGGRGKPDRGLAWPNGSEPTGPATASRSGARSSAACVPAASLLGVTATSALELGIDIGDLDAPAGGLSGHHRQPVAAGRAGRAGHTPRPVGAHRPGQPPGPVLYAPSPATSLAVPTSMR